jgi:hypothetical protein
MMVRSRYEGMTRTPTVRSASGAAAVRRRGEVDGVAELGELGDEPVAATVGVVAAGQVVGTQLAIGLTVGGHDVVGGDQDLVGDGNGGLALGLAGRARAGDPPELGLQVGVLGPYRGPGGLGERIGERHVAVGGPTRPTLAAGLVVARADPGPRGQMQMRGEL